MKGTCTDLEKPYFRLGADPNPAKVRPEHILKKSLKMLKNKWSKNEAPYRYMEEQFKSIRQDMTVQRIHSNFIVDVYETHARVAVEASDIDQFNQCQTALVPLYESGLKGCAVEFKAYRILYAAFTSMYHDDMNLLAGLSSEEQEDDLVRFAVNLRKAYINDDYLSFFKLYRSAPAMMPHITDCFLDMIRLKFLKVITLAL